jgi:hypothetical protein
MVPSADRALTGGELVPMPKDGLPVRLRQIPGMTNVLFLIPSRGGISPGLPADG